jgi:hypothetical protein
MKKTKIDSPVDVPFGVPHFGQTQMEQTMQMLDWSRRQHTEDFEVLDALSQKDFEEQNDGAPFCSHIFAYFWVMSDDFVDARFFLKDDAVSRSSNIINLGTGGALQVKVCS